MARTIRISKSKALNFKKLSFLYLIFIVFFFFSTSADFIKHFSPLAKTQEELNKRLLEQLNEFKVKTQDEIDMRKKALDAIQVITGFEQSLDAFFTKHSIKGERLKEQKFSREFLSKDENAKKLYLSLSHFILAFPNADQADLMADFGIKTDDLTKTDQVNNLFFKETPNGAIANILKHFETVVLTNTLKYLKEEIKDKEILKLTSSKDSSLLQGYKNTYYVGENIGFDFYSRDSVCPIVKINQVSLKPNPKMNKHFFVAWIPSKEGVYHLEAHIGEEFIRHTFTVIKPNLRFLENEQEIAAYIGEPLNLTLDLNGLQNIKDLNFHSNGAKIETNKDQLIITPLVEGRFTIEMRSENTNLDARSLFARKGKSPEVILKDVAGSRTQIKKAHCLESLSPYWQVLDFNITLVEPNGNTRKLKSSTRFLRNELRTLEANAAEGSTLIFDQIRLLNTNGVTTTMGAPIYIGK